MAKSIKLFFEQSWLLVTSAFVFGLLLSATNAAWQPRIIQNEIDKFNRLAGAMLEEAKTFEIAAEQVEIDMPKGKTALLDIKKGLDADGNCAGWAFVCHGSGFADKIRLVLTLDAGFETIKGFGVLSSNETPGFGDKIKKDYFRSQFMGMPAAEITLSKTGDYKEIDSEIIAITGATVSSEAVVDIVNNFVGQVRGKLKEKGLIDNGK
ncbi:MAG: FMN-binding protein [Planctomycetes bacterium]|nr:FMN-binding protein [Planctomycetota bacterium]